MTNSLENFYNIYHQKNDKYAKVIGENNFTYYEILRFFYKKVYPGLLTSKINIKTNDRRDPTSDFRGIDILDVGCGVGTLALYFSKYGASVKGIDVSSRAIDIASSAQKHLDLDVEFITGKVKKGREDKDLVVISEVIEHIEDEKEFLSILHSHLKKNGTLFLTTPLKENFLYKIGAYKKFDEEVGHLRRYTFDSIKQLLERNGFIVLHRRKVEGPLRNILYITKLGFIIRFIRGPLVPMYHWLDWISMKIFGASNILVAAKKVK